MIRFVEPSDEQMFPTYSEVRNTFQSLLDDGSILIASETNKEFKQDISLDDIGLSHLKTDTPSFQYKGNTRRCYMQRLPILRSYNVSSNFYELNENEKQTLLNDLFPLLEQNFTKIYKIVEQRHDFTVAYVRNRVDYYCYGCQIGY